MIFSVCRGSGDYVTIHMDELGNGVAILGFIVELLHKVDRDTTPTSA